MSVIEHASGLLAWGTSKMAVGAIIHNVLVTINNVGDH